MLNRKGDIPTTLILILYLVLIVVAISVFLSHERISINAFEETHTLSFDLAFKEMYVKKLFEQAVERSWQSADSTPSAGFKERFASFILERDPKNGDYGSFFAKIRNGDFILESTGDRFFLSIENISISSSNAKKTTVFQRTLSFEARLNEAGAVQYIYK